MRTDDILKNEEKVVMALRRLYSMHGYSCFKMNKFEEYDFYVRNKDFLVSDGVITFNDTDGKLMALKPDVTLSIIKNSSVRPEGVWRVYYNENVYRVSERTRCYTEIMQTGLECIGDVKEYDLFEAVFLAAESLGRISRECVLTVSNLDIIFSLLKDVENEQARDEIMRCIGEKNAHGLVSACSRCGVPRETATLLSALTDAYGEPSKVAEKIKSLTGREDVISPLERLLKVTNAVKEATDVRVLADLSLINDMKYYNGIVFKGYVRGLPSGVLSGGQYDRLMAKMSRPAKAVGFAVYLDRLEGLEKPEPYDVDVLLLYGPDDDVLQVHRRASELIAEGKSVSVQTEQPEKLTFREKIRFVSGVAGGGQNG